LVIVVLQGVRCQIISHKKAQNNTFVSENGVISVQLLSWVAVETMTRLIYSIVADRTQAAVFAWREGLMNADK
jgi:hypothetical protein